MHFIINQQLNEVSLYMGSGSGGSGDDGGSGH